VNKRRYTEHVDDKSKAAGILALCTETGRVLLSYGTKKERYTGFGGYLTYGETFRDGAYREFSEETMYQGPLVLMRAYRHQSPVKDFEYLNFVGLVPYEFQPMLDKENIEAEWFTLSQLYGGRMPLLPEFEEFTIEAKPFLDGLLRTFEILNE
jgi:ADP-ribose pyrophosphatase YjhB (NUDIX family)